MSVTMSSLAERRNHFRVHTEVNLRLRLLQGGQDAGQHRDAVEPYEELVVAAARFRKELSASGRAFVDKLLGTLDALAGQLAAGSGEGEWQAERRIHANLSVGGVGFLWSDEIVLEQMVEVEFAFGGEGSAVPFRAISQVARSELQDSGLWKIGLRFIEIPAATQQRLVRILYDMQRAELRMRSGTS